jgi:hypothetical protein
MPDEGRLDLPALSLPLLHHLGEGIKTSGDRKGFTGASSPRSKAIRIIS